MPCFFASSVWTLRNSSSSVMSASSCCVTCGMVTQLRCRFAPDSFLMRDSGCVVTGPNFAKSTCGSGSRLSPAPPSAAARARELGLHVILDVLLEHALLGSRALHARQDPRPVRARNAAPRGWRARCAKPASSTAAGAAGAGGGPRRRGLRRGLPARARAPRCGADARGAGFCARPVCGGRAVAGGFQHQHQRALGNLVADLDLDFLHHCRRRAPALPSSPCRTRA